MQELMTRATIDEIEGHRNKALALYAEAFDTLEKARQHSSLAAPSGGTHYIGQREIEDLAPSYGGHNTAERRGRWLDRMRKATDSAVWDHLIKAHGLERLMDATAREQFRKQLADNPPEATAENCHATLRQLIGDADLIFMRGIATVFSRLDRRFRSHDGFKIGSRVVLSRCFSEHGTWNHYANHDETLRDIERTFHTLDGKQQPERMGGIIGAIDSNRAAFFGAKQFEAENEYFRFRGFKNGNAHLWFKRDDLLEKVNLLLADYYGDALGVAPHAADKPFTPNRTPAKNYGEFFTPAATVERLLDRVSGGIDGKRILEPSAGQGAIAAAALAKGGIVTCVEIQEKNSAILSRIPGITNNVWGDFLDCDPAYFGQFDLILMNPPFDGQRDIDHVLHAAKFLDPSGELLAIMSAGTEFRENRKAVEFRAFVEARGGGFFDLPAGSFAESGTNINTCIVRFYGQARKAPAWER